MSVRLVAGTYRRKDVVRRLVHGSMNTSGGSCKLRYVLGIDSHKRLLDPLVSNICTLSIEQRHSPMYSTALLLGLHRS
jgi:hypothetical protein